MVVLRVVMMPTTRYNQAQPLQLASPTRAPTTRLPLLRAPALMGGARALSFIFFPFIGTSKLSKGSLNSNNPSPSPTEAPAQHYREHGEKSKWLWPLLLFCIRRAHLLFTTNKRTKKEPRQLLSPAKHHSL